MPDNFNLTAGNYKFFAPTQYVDDKTVKAQSELLNHSFYPIQVLDQIPLSVIIVNEQRQIVFANKEFRDNFENESISELLGLRPGESINCVNLSKTPGGCGTGENCRFCGAVNAILESQEKGASLREGIFTLQKNNALNVQIKASQIKLSGGEFTILALRDISQEKRKKSLERTFFHDILNLLGGLQGYLEILHDADQHDSAEFIDSALSISNKIIDEILSHRTLVSAENGDLQLNISSFPVGELLTEVRNVLNGMKFAEGKIIRINPDSYNGLLRTDKVLLRRVLINLGKNALEAVPPGETISIYCTIIEQPDTSCQFTVHNPGMIPVDIQYQLFQRSFSTKGTDRGIGTYSIKLLTENFLRGTVHFTSDSENGTKFIVRYPLSF